jgi:subtilisin family serine protease
MSAPCTQRKYDELPLRRDPDIATVSETCVLKIRFTLPADVRLTDGDIAVVGSPDQTQWRHAARLTLSCPPQSDDPGGKMARYVIANRRAGKFSAAAKADSRAEVATALATMPFATIIHDTDPDDPLARRVTVVEADPGAMATHRVGLPPDVIVEPEIIHYLEWVPPRDVVPFRRQGAAPAAVGEALFVIRVTGGGQPLPFATVKLYVRGFGSTMELTGQTDAAGQVPFRAPPGHQPSVAVVAPLSAYWSMVVRGAGLQQVIECPPLPVDEPLGWWHQALGLDRVSAADGSGIRVGVADTGLGPHPDLAHAVVVGAFVDGDVLGPDQALDVDSHGTHVAGTIGARPTSDGMYSGIAPGCELFAARVFPSAEAGASNADIANAIDALSRTHQVDLINLSLGSTVPSEIVHDAIIDAAERGTLCLCAAGNDAGSVNYPADFPEAVAVSALGLAGWGPPGSLSASCIPWMRRSLGARTCMRLISPLTGRKLSAAAPELALLPPYRIGMALSAFTP